MAKSNDAQVLSKKAKVVASTDNIVGVPAGTPGKVVLVNGITWIRYWVRFDNGITVGSVNRADLATPAEWERKLSGADDAVAGGTAGADGDDGGSGDGGADEAGVAVNGVMVPNKLLERSKAARARLAA